MKMISIVKYLTLFIINSGVMTIRNLREMNGMARARRESGSCKHLWVASHKETHPDPKNAGLMKNFQVYTCALCPDQKRTQI